ncbi:predicted protein [Nematostella vectensis]|uniref:Transmembrane protein 106A n=1 Tax=Nematostella vectensis TaxID=45351 RepID=A7RHY5_NEMVE|nr:predicted protein [Nematostella vectensis]|eukprot:XP_001640999.1 predicted protein [Nematostella vectensis]
MTCSDLQFKMFTSGEEFPSDRYQTSPNGVVNSSYMSFPYEDTEESHLIRTKKCPTCGGSGRLTSEQENDLVALIPVRDRRLKPRRTVLYLMIAILLCSTLASVTIALLFPRDVTFTLLGTIPVNITIKQSNATTPFIVIQNTLEVKNPNFFEVSLSALNQQVTWDEHYVVADVSFGNQSVVIPRRSSKKVLRNVTTFYEGVEGSKVRKVCCSFFSYNMLLVIDSTATASGLTLSQSLSNREYKFVDCVQSGDKWWDNCV